MGPTSIRLLKLKNYLNVCQLYRNTHLPSTITPVRYLRGSRYTKDHNQEELKYQRLLRTLNKYDSKEGKSETSVATEDLPASVQENVVESNDVSTSSSEILNLITPEDLIKKLEEKFTPLQGLLYVRQLERKYKKSFGVLRILGEKLQALKVPIAMGNEKLPCPVDMVIPSPVMEAYKNKDEFNIGLGLDGNEKTVGFFLDAPTEFSTTFCISPKELSIIKENHKYFAEDFQNYIRSSPLPASQHFSDGGYWKSLVVRSNTAGDLMGIVVMHPQDLNQEDLQAEKEKLKEYFTSLPESNYKLHSLYFQSCTHTRCTHEQSPFELLLGEPTIVEEASNLKLEISPDTFFHTNTQAAEVMYSGLLKLCRVNNSTTLLDVCCGNGHASFVFSPRVKRCIGIDDSTQAIRDARINVIENNVDNVEFIHGRPDSVIRDVLGNDYHEDLLVVINTSRTGITKSVITSLREFKSVKKIIYISSKPHAAVENFVQLCKPGGSAKNLGKAFLPILAVPVDLYPQTDQYGLIVMFQRL